MLDDDVELRDLLVNNLEASGTLSRIKAELRAAIFSCLDEKPQPAKRCDDERLCLSIAADCLRKLGMFNSLKVLEAEAGMVLESPLYTCDETELSLNIQNSKTPVIHHLLENKREPEATTAALPPKPAENGEGQERETNSSVVSLDQIKEKAKKEFDAYDHSKSGFIHIDDASSALIDTMPIISTELSDVIFKGLKPSNENNEICFENWWKFIERFYKIALSVTSADSSLIPFDANQDPLLTSRTNETAGISYTDDFTEEHSEILTKEDDLTEGRLPDSESELDEIPTTDTAQRAQENTIPDVTEDYSLRSNDDSQRHADFFESVN
ncbi:Oidioi.mRNA.OKI2018_I69.chr1.g608.t1.cds [Oikopleura dioica]|uniref:Oidioi.mRNA.OKI2018_I69.chr1.g608.t1.cds n=1 Tax=Oikopleura dioica TaxID=34765 RepID=A0ABN7SKD2_OIKDI|nr:Oidioi.mRNA.OKI2018_I69.chr1.g608.t1.cds [Oikopleura dioica]